MKIFNYSFVLFIAVVCVIISSCGSGDDPTVEEPKPLTEYLIINDDTVDVRNAYYHELGETFFNEDTTFLTFYFGIGDFDMSYEGINEGYLPIPNVNNSYLNMRLVAFNTIENGSYISQENANNSANESGYLDEVGKNVVLNGETIVVDKFKASSLELELIDGVYNIEGLIQADDLIIKLKTKLEDIRR